MTTKEGGLRGSIRNIGVGVGIPDSLVESWEDGITSEWSGDTGSFSIKTDYTLDGGQSLGGPVSGSTISSSSGDGLPRYPQKGDLIKWGSLTTALTGRKDWDFGNVQINEFNNNGSIELNDPDGNVKSDTFSNPTNTWLSYELEFDNPVVVRIYEGGSEIVNISSSFSSSLTEGEILIGTNSVEHRHDFLRIER